MCYVCIMYSNYGNLIIFVYRFLETRIYPAVVEYSKKLYKSIDFFKTEIGFFTNRLKIVRQSKVDAFTNQEHPDNQDFISDTDSTSSASSQRSNR